MRRSSALGGQLKFIYPDEICFAFNPNYLIIESTTFTSLNIYMYMGVGTDRNRVKEITVKFFDSRTKVYLSKLFQLMFEEPECVRSMPITVQVRSGSYTYFSFTSLVIWGSLAPGERFNALGVYKDDKEKRMFERTLIWFKNFPFTVSVFKYKSGVSLQGRYDNNSYGSASVQTKGGWNVSEIDDMTIPTISSGNIASPSKIIYFTSIRKFLAYTSDGKYYENWSGSHANGNSTNDLMNQETGLPRTDRFFIITDSVGIPWYYRFDGYNLIKAGISMDTGFMEVLPEKCFPYAKNYAVIKYQTGDIVKMISTFDNSFDYTFRYGDDTQTLIRLLISDETAGHYIRWIDSQGNLQYFLFKKGKTTSKTTLGNNSIEIQEPIRNMYFPNLVRTQNVALNVTHKVGAVHLPPEIFDWVKTILTSPIIDLYLGKDKEGNELWSPVTIEAGSVDYNNKEELHDIEIMFKTPAYNPQSF